MIELRMPTKKTESISLNALESIIDNHPAMDYQFNSTDREMAWDGFISLFVQGSNDYSKPDFEGRIPVQIKGHQDPKRKQIGKKRVKHKVAIDDLKAFATEKGVLYFQIYICGKTKEIYYSSLFPSKIADYLEKANSRGNKASLNIPFTRLEQDPKCLYYVVKQFNEETKKQGSAFTPLVQDRIRIDELDKTKSISASVLGATDSYSALLRLSSGDICLYGRTEGDKYDRPIEWSDDSIFFLGRDVQQEISVADEVFYTQYRCIADSEGRLQILPSPNILIHLTNGDISFRIVTVLSDAYRDARFLLRIDENKAYRIGSQQINGQPTDMEKECRYKKCIPRTVKTDYHVYCLSDLLRRQSSECLTLKKALLEDTPNGGILSHQ